MPPMRGKGGGVNAWAAAHTVSAAAAASMAGHLRNGLRMELESIISPRRQDLKARRCRGVVGAADRRRAQAMEAVTVLVVRRARACAAGSLRFDDRMHVCNDGSVGNPRLLLRCSRRRQ